MSITPQGRSVQAMYRDYRDGKLIVNRRYQRKLVWALDEKQKLIDSMLHDYPIPLVLLAELRAGEYAGKFEIIDGMQRLNAIFSFIEHGYAYDNRYFDLDQLARARQAATDGVFVPKEGVQLLSEIECANIQDYQLAITIYPANTDIEITEVFGRINAQGRQLSPQEQRQAGVSNSVSMLVRQLASDIRGDVSDDILDLANMPEISIEHENAPHGYGIRADDTIWCKQGILTRKQLRDSEDEQMILDIVASIALGDPIAASREKFDKFYDRNADESNDLEAALLSYGENRIHSEILGTFSVLTDMIAQVSSDQNFLRRTMRVESRNPIKTPFYALFMAVFDLVVRQNRVPQRFSEMFQAIEGSGNSLDNPSHYATTADRRRNINIIKGLIQDYFVVGETPAFTSGAGLGLQIENCLRRSEVETPRYETKQGFLALANDRAWNTEVDDKILRTACGIANLGSEGDIFIGVADVESDAQRVQSLDGVTPITVGRRFVVGVDREARSLSVSLDEYLRKVVGIFQQSLLTESLKQSITGAIDMVEYRGLHIVRIHIPQQTTVSFMDDRCFTRQGAETIEVVGPRILTLQQRFL